MSGAGSHIGYFVVEPTEQDGRSRGRYGPYTLAQVRDFLRTMPELAAVDVEHAIAVTTQAPGVAFVLCGTREARLPNGQVTEVVTWTLELTWYVKPLPLH